MDYSWCDLLGTVGVVFIVGSYLLLQLERWPSSSLRYSLFNGMGALLIIISLVFRFNFSAFLVELFWLIISVLGIVKYFKTRKAP